jgi:hypothetical protein
VAKITGSRSDEWSFWCSFTITLNFDNLQSMTLYDSLRSFLDQERLPFYSENEEFLLTHLTALNNFCPTKAHKFTSDFGLSALFRLTLRPAVYSQSIRPGDKPLETYDHNQLSKCSYSSYVTSSLTRGRICRLQLQVDLARAVILGSESHGTHDHILLSQIRASPNLEDQIPVSISPRNRVTRLYPQVLGSIFFSSYDS